MVRGVGSGFRLKIAVQRATLQTMTDGYDVAQICENGHHTNWQTQDEPLKNMDHCPRCGAATIMSCKNCSLPIRGCRYVSGAYRTRHEFFPSSVPAFCEGCGKAYPWTESRLDAAGDGRSRTIQTYRREGEALGSRGIQGDPVLDPQRGREEDDLAMIIRAADDKHRTSRRPSKRIPTRAHKSIPWSKRVPVPRCKTYRTPQPLRTALEARVLGRILLSLTFPRMATKYPKPAQTGESGVALVRKIATDAAAIFRPFETADIGIDGAIEFLTPGRGPAATSFSSR